MGFDSDEDKASREAVGKHSFNDLQMNPNLLAAAKDELQKKNKTDRAQLKKQMLMKEMKQKTDKDQAKKPDKGVIDAKTQIDNKMMQEQAKQKADAEKAQGQTEQGSKQV